MPDLIIPLTGGLSLQEDPTQCVPGTLRDCLNYEVTQQSGYSLRQGWWYYDGSMLGVEPQDFLYIYFTSGWNSVAARYGENIAITFGTTINVICMGFANLGSGKGVLVFANPIGGTNFSSLSQQTVGTPITGTISGFSLTGNQVVQQVGYYGAVSDPYNAGANGLLCSSYNTLVQNVIAASQSTLAVPGHSTTPPDSSFLLADSTYCVHDCNLFFFNTGTNASVNLLEGHVIKSVGGGTTYGTVLKYVITSGDWTSGNAAGYVIVYDTPLTTAFPANNTQMNAYSADGTTAIGNIFKYTSSGSLAAFAPNTRALIYKTTDQTTGYTSTFTGWSRPALTREIQYSQAYPGQTTGIGFGPTGGAPFSIYEYTRQGLTNILQQLTPVTSAYWPCQTASQGGSASWVNLNNIKLDDGVFATQARAHNAAGNAPAQYFQAQSYLFTDVPTGSAILGLQVELRWKTSTANNTLKDTEVILIKPDGTYTPNKATYTFATTVSTLYTFGGATDTWGHAWKLSDLTNATFGVFFRFTNVSTVTDDTANVDYVAVQVTYIPPGRAVYIRNVLNAAPTDITAYIVHYTLDNNTQFSSNNGVGTLSIVGTGTEAAFTAAGKSRVVGAGEAIYADPAHTVLLGWTQGTDTPNSLPCAAALNTNASRWEWQPYNFYADPSAQMALGANGVEFGVGFDGTYLIRVRNGRRVDLDNPRHVFGYAGNTHWGYNTGDINVSAPGRPLTVAGLQLSQAYNIGQPVVGFGELKGQTLAVFGPRTVFGFQGTDPTNYTRVTLSPALGAFEYTVANVEGEMMWTSFRGVETMQTTSAYGDFDTLPLSQESTPWLQPRLQGDSRIAIVNKRPVYAMGVRNKRQYRLFFADGYTYSLTKFGPEGIPMGMIGNYSTSGISLVARHLFQGIRTDGKEVLYACFDRLNSAPQYTGDPYVAKLDVGTFEGNASTIPLGYIELNPVFPYLQNNKLTPTTNCQYQYASFFCAALTGTNKADIWTIAGDDTPIVGDPVTGNYSAFPTTNTRSLLTLNPPLTQIFLPLPVTPSACNISAEGRMIRLRFETVTNFAGGPMRVTKVQVTYEVLEQEGGY